MLQEFQAVLTALDLGMYDGPEYTVESVACDVALTDQVLAQIIAQAIATDDWAPFEAAIDDGVSPASSWAFVLLSVVGSTAPHAVAIRALELLEVNSGPEPVAGEDQAVAAILATLQRIEGKVEDLAKLAAGAERLAEVADMLEDRANRIG